MSGWNAYAAPAQFLGNKSGYYGGTMSLDMQVLESDNTSYPMIVMSDGTTMLQYMTLPPGTSFLFPLTEAGQIANGSGNPGTAATQSQFQQVLANLAFVHVDADWFTGSDQVDLDNFSMTAAVTPTPEPAVALLLLPCLMAIGAVARRRPASQFARSVRGANGRRRRTSPVFLRVAKSAVPTRLHRGPIRVRLAG